ncbi:MAG: sigma-54-dependent Fis family transcriptional regulator [Acetobacter sp.]|nr:sigma-54-dependent Fis family transcriptional regulator [Acetobacter sp.]MBR2124583.1 sigma-54-dependent Fis family transcriptional regulator [Acetobacter sp.]
MTQEILIIDDEPDIRLGVEGLLSDEGYETRIAANSETALAAFRFRRPSLVILDVWLQGDSMDGIAILQTMKREDPSVPVVMISGHGTIETAVSALHHGAYDFIEKPFQADHLLVIVRRALETSRLMRENEDLKLRVGQETELFGTSSQIISLRHQIEKVAPTGSRILISGPPGSGKEVAARMIHAHSRRENAPFIVLNCATLEPNHFEEKLFGSETVSENGERRIGVLERAHGGTLLLDEVADMPLETQGKIVRTLQDQTFERLGSPARVKVDVRVLATTNRDLKTEIALKHFREDLYYRLAVVPLHMPSLKERRGDIPGLATLLLRSVAESAGLPHRELSPDALVALQSYDWPGNVRELRNLIERVLIMQLGGNPQEPIKADIISSIIGEKASIAFKHNNFADTMTLSLREARDQFETQYLEAQLLRFGGNISRTAAFVGMERSAFYRKLKQLGITLEDREAE